MKRNITDSLILVAVILFAASCLIINGCSSSGGSSPVTFTNTYGGAGGDTGVYITQTSDDGYIIAGYSDSFGAGDTDMYLVRTDSSGNELWNKTFGGTSEDWARVVLQTSDDGFVIVGATYSFGSGEDDIYLVRTDSSGNELWNKTFGGTGEEEGISLRQTSDGGFIILGYTTSTGAGSYDMYLVRTDSSGNELWNKTFGGTGDDEGTSLALCSDGGFALLGFTDSTGAGSYDMYLVRTDSSGNELWNKTFGGSSLDWGQSIQSASDGGFILLGSTVSQYANSLYAYLVKVDSTGDKSWENIYSEGDENYGVFVQPASDGGYVFTGFLYDIASDEYDIFLVKTDSSGNKVWGNIFGAANGNDDTVGCVQETSDGGYALSGDTGPAATFDTDVYFIKVDDEGNL